ncbi:outer membrane beta-barrel protein [Pedobacter sp. SYP-B3415]|uniref:type IX secretion/gliding motility protein PorT/SprT n=1 Tax=Pedobacter sp. SYP-B3415 TaxID=2496641 RepID=UPI00101C7988|nr:outer membrane beta-barrel protein [Pedobacter sp. SYP-B3415]
MKRITFLLLLTLYSTLAAAQKWGGGVDEEPVHFGFNFQYITSEYKVMKKAGWRDAYFDKTLNDNVTDSLNAIYGRSSPGFGIGFVVNYRLGSMFDVRMTPSLVFNDRLLNYVYKEPAVVNTSFSSIQQRVQTTVVDIPLGVKLKSDKIGNFRAYVLGGLKYSLDITPGKKTNDDDKAPINKLLKNQRSYLSYEAGIGFDIYFEYFKMSPELKLSQSLNDVLKHEDHPYATPIDRLMLRNVTFSLYFE